MPRYMFLLHDDESWFDTVSPESWADEMTKHRAFSDAVRAAGGSVLGGEALERSSLATTVDNTGDEPTVTDGPFIETKEVFGGYYVVDVADLDIAIALAKQCPGGHVEIRPVMSTDDGSDPPA